MYLRIYTMTNFKIFLKLLFQGTLVTVVETYQLQNHECKQIQVQN